MAPGMSQTQDDAARRAARGQQVGPRGHERLVERSLAKETDNGGDVEAPREDTPAGAIRPIEEGKCALDERSEVLAVPAISGLAQRPQPRRRI